MELNELMVSGQIPGCGSMWIGVCREVAGATLYSAFATDEYTLDRSSRHLTDDVCASLFSELIPLVSDPSGGEVGDSGNGRRCGLKYSAAGEPAKELWSGEGLGEGVFTRIAEVLNAYLKDPVIEEFIDIF